MFLILTLLACSDPPVAGRTLDPQRTDRPVWMFRQAAQGWVRNPTPIAHGLSSLGLGTNGDELMLTAQCFWGECGSIVWRHLVGPPVHALSTRDLQTWTPQMWRLVDPDDRVPIDTELRDTWVWYYGTEAGQHGDPALRAEDHTIYKARVSDDRLVEPTVVLSGAHLADPAPISFNGQDMLFLTTLPGREVGQAMGDPLRVTQTFKHVSVPHAMVVDDELWLWAHTVRDGKHVPVRAVSKDGQKFTSFEAVLPTDGVDCANPVGTVWQSQPVVFCVSEPLDGPQ